MPRLIDANAAVELLRSLGSRDYRREKGTIMDAMKMLSHPEYTPTVDAVEVVHGEWIRCLDVDDCEYIECPICSGEFYDGDNDTFDKPFNYCPNCGAKMDGDGSA